MPKPISICFILVLSLPYIFGHGRMEDPPARNAAWRFGFNVPPNYDDVGLNCGGLSIQKANDGKCGVCGDSYSGPRDHEVGGKYATNAIVRNYASGSLIDIKILLTANHVGFMEFRLCPVDDPNVEVTQECLDEHLLHVEGYGTQYPVNEGADSIFLRVYLPDDLSCMHCVLQWRYHAGNSWGTDFISGRSCLGCGYQEEFYNCADISIAPKDDDILVPSATAAKTHDTLFAFPYFDPSMFSSDIDHFPLFDYPTTTTTKPTTTTTTTTTRKTTIATMNVMFPFRSSNEHFHPLDRNNKTRRCYPINEILKPIVGIENWCLHLCAVRCPPALCTCIYI